MKGSKKKGDTSDMKTDIVRTTGPPGFNFNLCTKDKLGQNVSEQNAHPQGIMQKHITFRVEWVSPISAGVTVQIIHVLAFPPSDGWRIRVSFESRKGIWELYCRKKRKKDGDKLPGRIYSIVDECGLYRVRDHIKNGFFPILKLSQQWRHREPLCRRGLG